MIASQAIGGWSPKLLEKYELKRDRPTQSKLISLCALRDLYID